MFRQRASQYVRSVISMKFCTWIWYKLLSSSLSDSFVNHPRLFHFMRFCYTYMYILYDETRRIGNIRMQELLFRIRFGLSVISLCPKSVSKSEVVIITRDVIVIKKKYIWNRKGTRQSYLYSVKKSIHISYKRKIKYERFYFFILIVALWCELESDDPIPNRAVDTTIIRIGVSSVATPTRKC